MWDGINRRKFPRGNYKCLISIKKRLTSKIISTETENIGAGGICVMIKDDLGLFQGVDLELYIGTGDNPPVKCGGTVVWAVKKSQAKKGEHLFDTGIEFIDIRPEDREHITGIVEEILKSHRRK